MLTRKNSVRTTKLKYNTTLLIRKIIRQRLYNFVNQCFSMFKVTWKKYWLFLSQSMFKASATTWAPTSPSSTATITTTPTESTTATRAATTTMTRSLTSRWRRWRCPRSRWSSRPGRQSRPTLTASSGFSSSCSTTVARLTTAVRGPCQRQTHRCSISVLWFQFQSC